MNPKIEGHVEDHELSAIMEFSEANVYRIIANIKAAVEERREQESRERIWQAVKTLSS